MKKTFLRRFTKKFFILLNLITGILFLLGANVKYFDPVKWWFISLLTLALPYLLLFLVLFFFFWLFVKPFWMILPVIFILLSLDAVKNIFPFHLNTEFEIQKKSGEIRVMSWNVELFNILHYKDQPDKKQ